MALGGVFFVGGKVCKYYFNCCYGGEPRVRSREENKRKNRVFCLRFEGSSSEAG